MHVLITGAAGFIGSHLVERLLSTTAFRLTCVDNFCDYYSEERKRANVASFAADNRVSFFEDDISNLPRMIRILDYAQPQVVVHLAAHAGVTPSVAEPHRYIDNNVRGTLNLLEAIRHQPIERFVFVSSSSVYGKGCPTPFVEDGPMGIQASPYGASKRAAELLCQTYHQLHDIPSVILRPFSVYGSRLRPDLALSIFAERIHNNEPISLYGDGSVLRDFTHVSDICHGMHQAIVADDAVGECINLGNDQPMAMLDVLEELQSALGKRATIKHLPARDEDMPITHADLTKAKRLLGYTVGVSFADGLADFASWYLSHQPASAK